MSALHQPTVTDLLFVYGTLMQAFDNPYAHQLRHQSQFIGSGHLPGVLYRVSWYPGAVPHPASESTIHGEVYQLYNPIETLRFLDEYEDAVPDSPEEESVATYIRKQLPVQVGNALLTCWLYSYNASTADLVPIETGRWANE